MENVINYSSLSIDNILTELTVPYNDYGALTRDTEELRLVNYFFDSVSCHNKELETLLYEMIGYSLTRTNKLNKAFVLKGDGRNGKSKIFRICEALVGEKQCSHEHLEKISGSKVGAKSTIKALKGCTVNIAEDQKQPKYINTSYITRAISGEPIAIKENEILVPYATMLFSVNEVIDFKETGIYITDRFIVIPFNATFTDDNNNRDIHIGEKLCDKKALQIIATRAVKAFSEVLARGKFTIPEVVELETKKYFMECNNVAEFCSLNPISTIITKEGYFKEYRKWCKYNNKEAVCNTKFGKEVLALGYRAERYSYNNDRKTYYANPNFDNNDSQTIYKQYLEKYQISEDAAQAYDDNLLRDICGAIPFNDYLCELLHNENNVNQTIE